MAEVHRSAKRNVEGAACHLLPGHGAGVGIRKPSWKRRRWDGALRIEGICCLSSFPNCKVLRAATILGSSVSSEEQPRLSCGGPWPSEVAKPDDQERLQHSPGLWG